MKTLRWSRSIVIMIVLIGLIGCTAPPAPTGDAMQNQPASLKSAKERVSNPNAPAEDISALTGGMASFAVDLYQQLGAEGSNLFFSPYSISLALAMAQAGARGETLSQMNDTLHYTLEGERLHTTFNALDQELARRAEEVEDPEADPFRLNVANALWGQQGYPFQTNYLDLLAENYGAGMEVVDFSQDPEQARLAINDWIAKATEEKIKDIVPEGGIEPMTRLVLANAIYFNASWLNPFDVEFTKDEAFHLPDGSEKTVAMMHKQDHFGYARGEDYQLVELSYVSRSVVMDILLPDEGQFEAFEQTLNGERLSEILAEIGYSEVALGMPRFKFESSFGLSEKLKSMGMLAAFDPKKADFTGVAESNELYLQDVLHKAFISVDEAGTEAAAATVVMFGATAAQLEPVSMTIDRPFMFLIRDTASGAILFLGRVVEP